MDCTIMLLTIQQSNILIIHNLTFFCVADKPHPEIYVYFIYILYLLH